jgi:putative heme-binding domain-containing protein
MPGGSVDVARVIPLLSSPDDRLRHAAQWLVARHPEWGGELAQWFRQNLAELADTPPVQADAGGEALLESLLIAFSSNADIQRVLAEVMVSDDASTAARQLSLRVVAQAKLSAAPQAWPKALAAVIVEGDSTLLSAGVAAARTLPPTETPSAELREALLKVAADSQQADDLRVQALATVAEQLSTVDESMWSLLRAGILSEQSITTRTSAADALSKAPLTPAQLQELCELIESVSPVELNRLIRAFERSTDERLGLALLASLREASALSSLRVDTLRQTLANYGPAVRQGVDELESAVNVDAAGQRQRIEELLPHMAAGDVRRGHAVFYSAKAACSACHQLGFAGGTVGPELTQIGGIRTERDLLESILFPSLSFVQSYESTLLLTTDGKAISGRILDETEEEYVLATGVNEETRVRLADVEEMQPGGVSVMPAGLDAQLSVQELADLVAFLKNAK